MGPRALVTEAPFCGLKQIWANREGLMSFDQYVDQLIAPIAQFMSAVVFYAPNIGGIEIPLIVVWLAVAAIFMTVWLRFQPITGFKHAIDVVRGRYASKTDPGEVSSFQALATEISGAIGLGNIAGIAVAIGLGGPGAALWIAIFGFFAMSLKMAEATLGTKYRVIDEDGTVHAGPMYFLKYGFKEIGWAKVGSVLAMIYAISAFLGVFGGGNMFQSNQTAMILGEQLGWDFLLNNRWIVGVVFGIFLALVVVGGVKSIGKITSKAVPLMAGIYLVSAILILLFNLPQIPSAFMTIVTEAFQPKGVAGGAAGAAVIGIQRALFSNAAGVGTAGMTHAAAKTRHPATEGFTGMWSPFLDSCVVCMITALVVVVTGVYKSGDSDGIVMTEKAFSTVAPWFSYILMVIVVPFAFSTVLAYYYYGLSAIQYILGNSPWVTRGFQIVWIAFTIIGSAITIDSVVTLADALIFIMTIPNLIGVYALAKIVRYEILRHKVKVTTGAIPQIDPELAVGMGDHEPTEDQIAEARDRDEEEAREWHEIRERLYEDGEWGQQHEGE